MLFKDRMVVIHHSYGTPRVIHSLRHRLDRNHIYNELKVNRNKSIITYQLMVPKRDVPRALELLRHYKEELEQV